MFSWKYFVILLVASTFADTWYGSTNSDAENETILFEFSNIANIDVATENYNITSDSDSLDGFSPLELPEHQVKMTEHILRIFCAIQTKFLYIYVDNNVASNWANDIIKNLAECSSDGVIVARLETY